MISFTTLKEKDNCNNSFWESLCVGIYLKTGNTFSKNSLIEMGQFENSYVNLKDKSDQESLQRLSEIFQSSFYFYSTKNYEEKSPPKIIENLLIYSFCPENDESSYSLSFLQFDNGSDDTNTFELIVSETPTSPSIQLRPNNLLTINSHGITKNI